MSDSEGSVELGFSDQEKRDDLSFTALTESVEDTDEKKPSQSKSQRKSSKKSNEVSTSQSKKKTTKKKTIPQRKRKTNPLGEDEIMEEEKEKENSQPQENESAQRKRKTSQKKEEHSDSEEEFLEQANKRERTSQIISQPSRITESPPNKSRTIITHMILENFKSYSGVQEIGPFHQCFSSVVGPNGSGKSNVIDALLFVFGKKAKQLRHKKVSELIHNSVNFPDLTYAKVSIFFQDIIDQPDSTYQTVENSNIVISRTAFKNNSSKYFINDKVVKFEDIAEVLEKKGIDLNNNRFLILQGEVEQIAMMKPKAPNQHEDGLLEYLEEIIGTNVYVEEIEKTGVLVEEANEFRNQKLNRVKLIEKERDSLEGAKTEAEEYLNKSASIIDKKSIMIQFYRHEAERKNASLVKKKEEIEEELTKERENFKETGDQLSTLDQQLKKSKREYSLIENEMQEAKSQHIIYERKDIKYREDIKHFKERKKKLSEAMKKEEKKIEEKKAQMKKLEKEEQYSEQELITLNETLEEEQKKLEDLYVSLRGETSDLQEELEAKQKEIMPWNKKMIEHQSKIDLKKSELEIARERIETSQKQLEQTVKNLKEYEEKGPVLKKKFEQTQKTLEEKKTRLEEAKKEYQQLTSHEEPLMERLRNLRNRLEEAKSSAQDASTKSKVLDGLLKAKSKKKLAGILGRLGDLGTIDSKYDVAISTACGALNNIVVDTTSNAESCVEYLRSNHLGVATFIILEKVQYLQSSIEKPFSPPKNAERLFDLIKVKDSNLLPAFYYALQNTLVTKDLETATKIAYGPTRFRVVTLDGSLIDTSGTMSGGGAKKESGGMKAKFASEISDEEITELETKVAKYTEKLGEIRESRQMLEQEIENLTMEISNIEMELPKIEMDIKATKTALQTLQARIPELKSQTKPTSEETKIIKQFENELAALEADMEKTKKKYASLEEEVAAIQQRIMDAGGTRLREQKTKVEQLLEQINNSNSTITKAKVQTKTSEKAILKAEKAKEEAEKELEEIERKLEETLAEFKAGEESAIKVFENYNAAQELLTSKEREIKEIQKNLDKLKVQADKFRSIEVDLQNQIETVMKTISDNDEKAQQWSKKLTELNKQKARTRIDEMEETTSTELLPVLSVEELEKCDVKELQKEIGILEQALQEMKPNMNAIKEFRRKQEEYQSRMQELDEATSQRDELKKKYDELRKRRLDEFMAGFRQIALKLKEMYQMITLGGDAELDLVDAYDPFEGIVFSVRPPRKSWKNISNLSGGEKTLSSLALVFALHHYKPTPLYVMDEIDAALDFKNVSIIANYIKERTKNAQFIIISLRNYMFELADYLVGIYKTQDCSSSVTINPSNFQIPTTAAN